MAVFYVHEPSRGIVTPLDDKYRIRQILTPDELNEIQKTHRKVAPNPENYQRPPQQEPEQPPRENRLAATAYAQTRDQQTDRPIKDIARSVMSSPVINIPITATLFDAWTLMQRYEINHVVIIDEQHRLAGLLSEKNILPFLISQPETDIRSLALDIFCQRTLLSATPDTDLYELAQVMLENRLDGIVIIENNALQGIITYPDIIKVLLRVQQLETFA